MTLDELITVWTQAKESERQATELRRGVEDEIRALLGVADDLEGTALPAAIGVAIQVEHVD